MCLGNLSSCVSLVCYIHKIIACEIFQLLVNKIKERDNNLYQTNHQKNHNARLFLIVVGTEQFRCLFQRGFTANSYR